MHEVWLQELQCYRTRNASQLHTMTFALPSIKEAILNPEFKKSGKIR